MWKKRSHKVRLRRRLVLEALEPLCMLSSVTLDELGMLQVQGDDAADEIAIVGLGGDKSGDTVEVTIGGKTATYGHVFGIVVDTAGGNDDVSVMGKWSALSQLSLDLGDGDDVAICGCNSFGGDLDLRLDLGDGDDVAAFEPDNDFEGALQLTIDAGAGDDKVSMQCDSAHDTAVVSLALGAGNDTATFYENEFDGAVQLAVDAGAGNDAVSFTCNGMHDAAILSRTLGAGDDAAVFDENMFDGPMRLIIDGGGGNDEFAFTENTCADGCDLRADLGAGDDAVTWVGNTFDGSLQLTLDTGAGSDVVSLQCNQRDGLRDATIIAILLGSGDDVATVHQNVTSGIVELKLDAGSGNDAIAIDGQVGDLRLDLDAGAGDDDVHVSLMPEIMPEIAPVPEFRPEMVVVRLGAGNDTADVHVGPWTDLDKPHSLLVDGGVGDDHIAVGLELPEGHTGPLDVRLLGGTGNDDLSLLVDAAKQDFIDGLLLLDGGKGKDKAVATSNVTVVNVESS